MEVLQNLSISFLWGGRRAISGDETYSVEESGSGLTYTSNLTVSDVEKRDEGEYTCTVKVSGGGNVLIDVTEYIFVSVLGKGNDKTYSHSTVLLCMGIAMGRRFSLV